MKQQDYTITMTVNAGVTKAFKAINNVTEWWTENLEGRTQKLHDEFTVRFDEVHVSTQKLIEFTPDKKVVWLVTASKLNFVSNQQEWTNTKISFELEDLGSKTKIRFTHIGLMPKVECYDACSNAWGGYLQESLVNLINTGKGNPEVKKKDKVKSKIPE